MKQLLSKFFSCLFTIFLTFNLFLLESNASLKVPSGNSVQKSAKDSWSTLPATSMSDRKMPIKIAPKSYESEIKYLNEGHRHFINEIRKMMVDYDYNDIYTLEKKDLNWHHVKGGISVGLKNKDFHLEDRTYKFYNFEIPESLIIGGKTYPVVAIKDKGFYGCNVLKKIYIPKTVKRLAAQAFDECNELLSVYAKGELNYIGNFAFSGCKNLQNVCFSGNIKNIGENIFMGSNKLTAIYFYGDKNVLSTSASLDSSDHKIIAYVNPEYKFDFFAGLRAIKKF